MGEDKIKVLVVGLPSARMHCVVEKLCQGGAEVYSYCPTKHPGLLDLSKELNLGGITDVSAISIFAVKVKPDFALVDTENALEGGVVNFLQRFQIPCIGPTKNLAWIESSKDFMRMLMLKYEIPGNPEYMAFTRIDGIKEYLKKLGEYVVKPNGLTGGKGVKVLGDDLRSTDETIAYCKEVLKKHMKVLIEEKFMGEEFSLQGFYDGKTLVLTPPVRDHKRAYNGDAGPNTGSMGSYSFPNHSLPFLELEDVITAEMMLLKIVGALQKETGEKYKGIIYGAFIKTKDGIKVIEINARGGDPEFVNILSILQTNFLDLCLAIVNGTLAECKISFAKKATVCKYVVPNGYPTNPQKGCPIYMSGVKLCDDLRIYYGAVELGEDGVLYMTGSRAVLFVGIGDIIEKAENVAELAAMQAGGAVFHRKDIGTSKLIRNSVDNMRKIPGK